MKAYVLLACLKQVDHHLLSQPDGFILKSDVDFYTAIFGLVNKELALLGKVGHVISCLLCA